MFFGRHLSGNCSFWATLWINHWCVLRKAAAWTVTAWAPTCKVVTEGSSKNFEKFLTLKCELRFELHLVFWDLC